MKNKLKRIFPWFAGAAGTGAGAVGITSVSAGVCIACFSAPLAFIMGALGVSFWFVNGALVGIGVVLVLFAVLLYCRNRKKDCKDCKVKNRR